MSTATPRPSPAPHAPHEPPVVMVTPALALFPSHSNGYYVHGHPYGHPTIMVTPTPTLFPSYSNGYVHNVHGNGYVLMSPANPRPSPTLHAPHGPLWSSPPLYLPYFHPTVMAVLTSTATLRPSPAPHAPHEPPVVMVTPTSTLFPSHSMDSYVHGHPMAFTRPTCAPWPPVVMATPIPALFPSHSNGILISMATPMATPQSWPPLHLPYFHPIAMAMS